LQDSLEDGIIRIIGGALEEAAKFLSSRNEPAGSRDGSDG